VPIGYLLDVYFGIPDDVASGDVMLGLIDEAAGVIVPVTTTWLALNAPWIFQLDFSNRPYEAAVNARMTQEPVSTEKKLPSQFLQELRSRAPGDLISISSELHYLRVTTTEAEVMFLYNLKDAIGELPLNSGVQIHRSHWVSKDHVKKLSKKDGNAECLLSNGKSLPVSRRKHSEVKDLLATKA
jgi:DNA-binding LytR/AlgR family response regulator